MKGKNVKGKSKSEKHYCECTDNECVPKDGCLEWNRLGACRWRLSEREYQELKDKQNRRN